MANNGKNPLCGRKPTFPCSKRRAKCESQVINLEPQDPFLDRKVLLETKRMDKIFTVELHYQTLDQIFHT